MSIMMFVSLLSLAGAVPAQDSPAPSDGASGPTDPVEIEAFFDGWITRALEEEDVPGASLAVVRDGEVLVAKGYGSANVADDRPADGDTLFRIGSISKVLTWIAVQQLVDEGALDLDQDVNVALAGSGVQVPATFPEPVTMRHLMTHTAGFEDRVIGLFGRDATTLVPLAELLAAELPRRVRPPGVVASYSNHGTALAGLVVERLRGEPWQDVVESRILAPLGMTGATVRQSVPAALAPHLAEGYDEDGEPIGFEFVPLASAGAVSASATSMARLMIALLQHGRFGDERILTEEGGSALLAPERTPFDGADAMGRGLIERRRPGVRMVGHGGSTLAFHSQMALLPSVGVGLFVSFNGASGAGLPDALLDAVDERWFPAAKPAKLTPADEPATLAKYAGHYRMNRHSHTTYAKLGALGTVEVSVTQDGALKLPAGRFVRIGDGVFRAEAGAETFSFETDGAGKVTRMLRGDLPIVAWERVPWRESMPAQAGLFVIALVVFFLTVIGAPAVWLLRKAFRSPPRDPGAARLPVFTRGVRWLTAAGFLAFVAVAAYALREPQEAAFGTPPLLDHAFWIPLATTFLTALLGLCLLVAAFRKSGTLWGRVRLLVVTLLAVAVTWQLWFWNLLDLERARALWERLTTGA